MARTNILKTKAFWATATTAGLVLGTSLAAVAGHQALSRYAGAYAGNKAPLSVRFNWPIHETTPPNPDGSRRSWLPFAVQQDLTVLALEHLTPSTTDSEALAQTAAALSKTGWFESIDAVRRADGNIVEVIAQWRTPVAVVRVAGSVGQIDRLVSAKGELLPVDYPAGTTQLRYITGVAEPAPESYGSAWRGVDVEAALKLLAYLYNSPIYSQVAGIDAAQYGRGDAKTGRKLVVMTDTGGRIVWGAAPEDWAPSEPSTDQKLRWLMHLKNGPEYGRRIDAGRPLVDVTNPRGILIDQPVGEASVEQSQGEGSPGVAQEPVPSHQPVRAGGQDRRRAGRG